MSGHARGHGYPPANLLASDNNDQQTMASALQLPTPRVTPQPDGPHKLPVISDSLFDNIEAYADSAEHVPIKSYTAPSGNPMLTVIDQNGVFNFEVVFCVCCNSTSDDHNDEQLLRSGLFPATFKSIKTVFTFSVLDDFLKDNLECKTTAQQYYSKLQSTTSKMFPSLVPVCCIHNGSHLRSDGDLQNMYRQLLRASRQWRDLKNRMEQGLGLQSEHSAADGAMAIFCPACPQPGINLPDDWAAIYPPFVII